MSDTEPNYKQCSIAELQDALAQIDGHRWPDRKRTIEIEIARRQSVADGVSRTEDNDVYSGGTTMPTSVHGPFEIPSTLYRRFLWTALVSLLILDFVTLSGVFANRFEVSNIFLVFAILGVSLRLAVFVVLLMKKGPLEPLVYIWGGLFVFSGVTGLLSLMLTSESTSVGQYLNKGLILVLGLLLVVPLSSAVTRKAPMD